MKSQIEKLQAKIQADMKKMKKCYPAYDELLMYSLERHHLDIPEISDLIMSGAKDIENGNITEEYLTKNVGFMKIDEISFDSDEEIHLPGVESVITSMRNWGYSLIFIVQGTNEKTVVYLGLSNFSTEQDSKKVIAAMDSYQKAWEANFPGTKLSQLEPGEIRNDIARKFSDYKNFGVLSGIPSLKRDEDSNTFVQGLERLIRAMRGKRYSWVSIADPIPNEVVNQSIKACMNLRGEVHNLVETTLSKATSNGKTVMLGMFGMLGQGDSKTTSDTVNEMLTEGTSRAETITEGSAHTSGINRSHTFGASQSVNYSATVKAAPLGVGGSATVGGTTGVNYGYSRGWNESDSTSSSLGTTEGLMRSVANGIANTLANTVSRQFGGGGFGSFGLTFSETTTVGQTLLNTKFEYIEKFCQAYEDRLREGTALGMWNLGHYFCAEGDDTYKQGIGVIKSIFSGMDSTFEPPRAIKVPESFREHLQRFNNIYLNFTEKAVSLDDINKRNSNVKFVDNPLGMIFNGPCTPVNTRELAVAMPIATQDIEGISVAVRPSFGLNLSRSIGESLSVGKLMDKGNELLQNYDLSLKNLPKHLAVFGVTGSGKTNTMHHMLIQLWRNHSIPFMVIEPAKAEYRALANEPSLKDDLLIISAGVDQSSVCPLRLNPFYFDPGKDNDANRVHVLTHIDRLKSTFNASFPMYASMPYILEEAILEVYRERGWDLGRSVNRYVDIYNEDFSDFIPTLHDLWCKVDAIVKQKGYFKEQEMNIQAALKARLSSLMVGSKGNMFNCLQSIPAKDLFERPVVIELENLGDDDEKSFLMGLLVSKLYEYRKATMKDGSADLKHVLVIEEGHRLLANIPDTANMEVANVKGKAVSSFVDMLSEIRSYGQSVMVVDQLPSRVSPNIVKGSGAKLVHRLLAKDDRESVGWTMGMTDDQINDLSLLRTGECVISQDGDLKSFMCKVPLISLHEERQGGEISEKTKQYKEENADLFSCPENNIDQEDQRFNDSLYSAMLAVGNGYSPELIDSILPTNRFFIEEAPAMRSAYWEHICREIWAFYGGNYQLYLELLHTGSKLITDPVNAGAYRDAFAEYFRNTKSFGFSGNDDIVECSYEQLIARKEIVVQLNKLYDRQNGSCNIDKLAMAIKMTLNFLIPKSLPRKNPLVKRIVAAIINATPLQVDSNSIWNKLISEEEVR